MIDEELEAAAIGHLMIAAALICEEAQRPAVAPVPKSASGRQGVAASLGQSGAALAAIGKAIDALVIFGSGVLEPAQD